MINELRERYLWKESFRLVCTGLHARFDIRVQLSGRTDFVFAYRIFRGRHNVKRPSQQVGVGLVPGRV